MANMFEPGGVRRDDFGKPARQALAVTPNDSNDLTLGSCQAIYVGVAGDLTVIHAGDTASVTYKNAAIGYHPLSVRRVLTSSTATNIVALY